METWIKVNRSIMTWRWYKDPLIKSVFLHILLAANIKEHDFEDRVIKKGQLVTSFSSLVDKLGISEAKVRRAIKKLKDTGEILTDPTNKYTVITVINYEKYQGKTEKTRLKQLAKDKETSTNKECNNGKSINNTEEIFDYN